MYDCETECSFVYLIVVVVVVVFIFVVVVSESQSHSTNKLSLVSLTWHYQQTSNMMVVVVTAA